MSVTDTRHQKAPLRRRVIYSSSRDHPERSRRVTWLTARSNRPPWLVPIGPLIIHRLSLSYSSLSLLFPPFGAFKVATASPHMAPPSALLIGSCPVTCLVADILPARLHQEQESAGVSPRVGAIKGHKPPSAPSKLMHLS